jgi:hypothetical protein
MTSKASLVVINEIKDALLANEGQLGAVFRLYENGTTGLSDIVSESAVANIGAASNLVCYIETIITGDIPTAPSRAAGAGRTIGGLIRSFEFTPDSRLYLQDLRIQLDDYATNTVALQVETAQFEKQSDNLASLVEQAGGVYVYSFPTYIRNPAKTDPERFWFKIGMTDRIVGMRIADQTRSTAMPEDPLIMRVYRSEKASNTELETKFHSILTAAGHNRTEARHGGKEWFATNLEFLDALAVTLDLEVLRNEIED